jgi:hypothetical protein
MLTRGYFIGEIVDDLAALASQVKMRNALHLFDLTVVAEDFFKGVLNILLGANFKNLNATRSNEPGLDLGDEVKGIGFQVTSSAGSEKVKHTLQKITADQASKYTKIIVLGMNKRQRKYTIDSALMDKYSFKTDDIWDLDTLARKAFDLELDKLQELYNLVRSSSARLKMELEVPDENGKYPTSGYAMWEETPDVEAFQKALKKLGTDLSRLPRLTREFMAMLYERRERRMSRRFRRDNGFIHLLLSTVERQYHGDDLQGELDILKHAGFLDIDGEDYELGPAEIGVKIPSEEETLTLSFLPFVMAKGLEFKRVIGSVDLSAF